jgi:hypothetical protein
VPIQIAAVYNQVPPFPAFCFASPLKFESPIALSSDHELPTVCYTLIALTAQSIQHP